MPDSDASNKELFDALEAERGKRGKYASQMLKTAGYILKQNVPDIRQAEVAAYCIRQALSELVKPIGIPIKDNKAIIDKILAIRKTVVDGQCNKNSALLNAIDELGDDRRGINEKYTAGLIEEMVGSAHDASRVIKQYVALINTAGRTLHSITRVNINTVRGDYKQALSILKIMFLSTKRIQKIQKLAKLNEPTKNNVQDLRTIITTSSDWGHFAENMVSAKWLELLEEEKLLQNNFEGEPWKLRYFADYLDDRHYDDFLEFIDRHRRPWGKLYKHDNLGNLEMTYVLSKLGDRGITPLVKVLDFVEPLSKNFHRIHNWAYFALTKATQFSPKIINLVEWLLKNLGGIMYRSKYDIINEATMMASPSDIPTIITIIINELKNGDTKNGDLTRGLYAVLKRAEYIGTPKQQLVDSLSSLNSLLKNKSPFKIFLFSPRAEHIEGFQKLIKYDVKLEKFLEFMEEFTNAPDDEPVSGQHTAVITPTEVFKNASQSTNIDLASGDFDTQFKNEAKLKNTVKDDAAQWAKDPLRMVEMLQKPRLIAAYFEGLSKTDTSLVPFAENILLAIRYITKRNQNLLRPTESWQRVDIKSLNLIEAIIKDLGDTNQSMNLLHGMWDVISAHLKHGAASSKTYADDMNYIDTVAEAQANPSVSATYTAICLLRFNHSKEYRDMILAELERLLLLPAKEGGALYRAIIGPNMPVLHYVSKVWFAKNKSLVFDDGAPDNLGKITFIFYLAFGNPHKQMLEGRAMEIINVTSKTHDTDLIYKLWHGMFGNLTGYKPRDIAKILCKIKDVEYVSSACWSLSKILRKSANDAHIHTGMDFWECMLDLDWGNSIKALSGFVFWEAVKGGDVSRWEELMLRTCKLAKPSIDGGNFAIAKRIAKSNSITDTGFQILTCLVRNTRDVWERSSVVKYAKMALEKTESDSSNKYRQRLVNTLADFDYRGSS